MLASILVHYLEKETTTLYSRFSSQARHKSCDRPLGSWDAKTMCELAQGYRQSTAVCSTASSELSLQEDYISVKLYTTKR
ncbi:hypothetical protein IAQ61_001318 [Plenodomus lingam]|uniref:uncharacterized protein n=1 Tax=Leptosphaeria maculans TaxID=5022 RepID=UPI003318310B|nr:hypothetical protein IAQ61_001318 [Plenodomus lingam]